MKKKLKVTIIFNLNCIYIYILYLSGIFKRFTAFSIYLKIDIWLTLLKINFEELKKKKKNPTFTELNIHNILKPPCYIFLYIFTLLHFILIVFHISKKFTNSEYIIYLKKKNLSQEKFHRHVNLNLLQKTNFAIESQFSFSSFASVYRRNLELLEILKYPPYNPVACSHVLPCRAPHLTIPPPRIHPPPSSFKAATFRETFNACRVLSTATRSLNPWRSPLDRSKREKRGANKELDGRGVKWRLFHPIVSFVLFTLLH